jgi:uncharacterized metal-binding protein
VTKLCSKEEWNKKELPRFCPMLYKQDVIDAAMEKYKKSDRDLYVNATITEQRAYMDVRGRIIAVRPRILEVIKFSEMMGWKKLGVAFCIGLKNEAERIVEIFEDAGLNVYSVCCKCGNVDKSWWGIEGEDKITNLSGHPEAFEAGCNPVVQAEILNSEDLDMNLIVGLCIGHDIQFTQHSIAPVSTLIVKDRVTGHDPMVTLYSGYHHPRFWKEKDK